jgi:hypothetical protein
MENVSDRFIEATDHAAELLHSLVVLAQQIFQQEVIYCQIRNLE